MFEKLLEIVAKKREIDQNQEWYTGAEVYFSALSEETEEIQTEMKENNKVYLEDELGDILWTSLNLIDRLKQEGKIDGIEAVIKRAEKKYGERVLGIDTITGRKKDSKRSEVKAKQKIELKKEHNELYGE